MGDWDIEREGKESKWEADLREKKMHLDLEELRWRK